METDRYQVVERRLKDARGNEVTLADWITDQRSAPTKSWQMISFELWQITDVRVNPETLRRWHSQNQEGEEVRQ